MRRNSAALKFLHLTVYSSLALINWAQNVSLNVEMSICFSCVISSCEAFSTDMLLESAKGERKNECVDEIMKGFIVFASNSLSFFSQEVCSFLHSFQLGILFLCLCSHVLLLPRSDALSIPYHFLFLLKIDALSPPAFISCSCQEVMPFLPAFLAISCQELMPFLPPLK